MDKSCAGTPHRYSALCAEIGVFSTSALETITCMAPRQRRSATTRAKFAQKLQLTVSIATVQATTLARPMTVVSIKGSGFPRHRTITTSVRSDDLEQEQVRRGSLRRTYFFGIIGVFRSAYRPKVDQYRTPKLALFANFRADWLYPSVVTIDRWPTVRCISSPCIPAS